MAYPLPPDVKLPFSGHETFPLRQLWLSKIAQYIKKAHTQGKKPAFKGDEAMIELGVGKNMVASMRYWAEASGMIAPYGLALTELGKLIFGFGKRKGLDEDCASMTTQWLVHWRLAATPERFPPAFYLFNLVTSPTLDRERFLTGLIEFAQDTGSKTTAASIKRALDVCLRSYLPRMSGKGHAEDLIEPLLGELDLLEARSREAFAFHRGRHPTLPDALFVFALMEYWERLPYQTSSLDFTRIAHDYGSPGKVFKLDADALNARLANLAELTNEDLVWTEQAGLRQVIRRGLASSDPEQFKIKLLKEAYA